MSITWYPGQYFDAESGLHYNINRDYEPSSGRYVQSDPIGINGGIATYAYADSSPTTAADPLGLFSIYGSQLNTGEWQFRFSFNQACIGGKSPIDWADSAFQRVPFAGKLRRAQTKLLPPLPAGDNDAKDACACRAFDDELKKHFLSKGWSEGSQYGGRGVSYSEANAQAILNELQAKMGELNRERDEDCKACSMPWSSLLKKAKSRGAAFIGNSISR